MTFDFTNGFGGDVLPPVAFEDALHRVRAYCTDVNSGWSTYDLCGIEARLDGYFEQVRPWSLLAADALAGQIQVRDVARFDARHRVEFANRLMAVPPRIDLDQLDATGRAAVTRLCQYGFSGVWAPKMTKVAALFRPQAVPVLDGYVSLAFGFSRQGFSEGREPRWERIARVIDSLALSLGAHREFLGELRVSAIELAPDLPLIPDLRLLDIIIWTSQDDRMVRQGKPAGYWLNSDLRGRRPITRSAVAPVSVATGSLIERDLPPSFAHWSPPLPPAGDVVMDLPRMRWARLDLQEMADYKPWKHSSWYDQVPWASVMEALEPHVELGKEVDGSLPGSRFDQLPKAVQEGVRSVFDEPLGIQPDGQPIGGGHRMLAMKRQGLRYAYGMY